MKKLLLSTILIINGLFAFSQAPHIYEHTYPKVTEENPQIRALMDKVSIDSLTATIEHLSSYHTRRYDSQMIYEVQDWQMSLNFMEILMTMPARTARRFMILNILERQKQFLFVRIVVQPFVPVFFFSVRR